uniref:Uncharacterized protein n=1 Tax=Strigamia maritima TaxID=126957 RepID=T1JNT3_STRMM
MDFLLHCIIFLNVLAMEKLQVGYDYVKLFFPSADIGLFDNLRVIERLKRLKNKYETNIQNQECEVKCKNDAICQIKEDLFSCAHSGKFKGEFYQYNDHVYFQLFSAVYVWSRICCWKFVLDIRRQVVCITVYYF